MKGCDLMKISLKTQYSRYEPVKLIKTIRNFTVDDFMDRRIINNDLLILSETLSDGNRLGIGLDSNETIKYIYEIGKTDLHQLTDNQTIKDAIPYWYDGRMITIESGTEIAVLCGDSLELLVTVENRATLCYDYDEYGYLIDGDTILLVADESHVFTSLDEFFDDPADHHWYDLNKLRQLTSNTKLFIFRP